MKSPLIYITFLLALISACVSPPKSYGDKTIAVFHNDTISFSNKKFSDSNIVHLAQGRIILKKINLPIYEKQATAKLKLSLQSNGDSWDKSGSVFVIDKRSKINLLNLCDSIKLPTAKNLEYAGILASEDYKPLVELMRFMTPFGVGFYSEKARRKPVYIPKYEKKVEWVQDVTDRLSLLEGETWVGVWIDTWTASGYKISMELQVAETKAIDYPKPKSHVEPLVNTVAYIGGQKLPDFFANQNLETEFTLPKNAKNVQLKYIVTGHGGHEGGDEFTKQENKILIDGKEILSFIPWRDDCASFRRFNPTSGVWLAKDTASYFDEKLGRYNEKVIEERIASSDLSRSNWCPGSDIVPITVKLPNTTAGKHKLTISIPNAQAADKDKLNHWLVSAYLCWEE